MPRNIPHITELMRLMSGEDQPEKPTFPVKEAQRDMLRQAVALSEEYQCRDTFNRGDRVHYMSGTGALRSDIADGLVWVFWRYLEDDCPEDKSRITNATNMDRLTLPSFDCLVACFTGETFRFDICCSQILIPGDK